MATKAGKSHKARKELFARGLRRGWLSMQEIDEALEPFTISPAERWLLYYSLRAANIEIRGPDGQVVEPPHGS